MESEGSNAVIKQPEIKQDIKQYPLVEEMTFRGIVQSEQEAYALLRAVQILVNEFGASSLISIMAKVEAKPALMQKAKSSIPYLLMM